MPISRKETKGGWSFAFPLVSVVVLLASYLLLSEWQDLPNLINSAIAAVHWPT